ncbi:hypothetical protein ACWD64_07870 [Streptomyces antibioticus]
MTRNRPAESSSSRPKEREKVSGPHRGSVPGEHRGGRRTGLDGGDARGRSDAAPGHHTTGGIGLAEPVLGTGPEARQDALLDTAVGESDGGQPLPHLAYTTEELLVVIRYLREGKEITDRTTARLREM